ncbi:hypothetical protein GIB67_025492 [Kingdonia uniflora]|uniref:Uncharacterized protein n=1 Tax=Kingdonia uniflora TaxID=39325 RepID=A0A7J7PCI5_9MAGN|nr:hypothetical protein GIB67_025492 [Kingdonia uniflora]
MPRGRTVMKKPTLAQGIARIEDQFDKLVKALGAGAFFPSPPQPPLLGATEDLSLEGSIAARSDKFNNLFMTDEEARESSMWSHSRG